MAPANFDYHFSGWATKYGVKCTDGRTIMKDAFAHQDGERIPLVWNHDHSSPDNLLGEALLEHRDEGVYAYGRFDDDLNSQYAKKAVMNGIIKGLSIHAGRLKQHGPREDRFVEHGELRELSLVYGTANPSAYIEDVIMHGADGETQIVEDEGIIYTGETIVLNHSEETEEEINHEENTKEEKETKSMAGEANKEKTVQEVFDELTEEQKTVVYAMIGQALEEGGAADDDDEAEHSEGGDNNMKRNVFDQEEVTRDDVLTHADQEEIIKMAKASNVGSLRMAMDIYAEENDTLSHGFETEALTALLPDYKNLTPGAPEILRADQSWVMGVINKIHKSPYSRIRTRQADARIAELKAKGYQNKGDKKKLTDNIKLIGRSFDPQTVYIKDEINRDDIIDITDFSVVDYIWNLMKDNMYETLALAALVGDGREDTDPDKIHENHIRSIWNDDELYTIHRDVDIEAARTEIQGTNTNANFSENFIYAEAIIREALYAREKFKGSGRPDLYCAPHLVNVMLLARDLNGRRIYDSKADLAQALNVGAIHEIEQLDGRVRTTEGGDKKKLLGLFVNLADYQFGSTKGGEITKFEDFDIDFNKYKYLMETRLSGALVKPYAAIALEEPVNEAAAG